MRNEMKRSNKNNNIKLVSQEKFNHDLAINVYTKIKKTKT